MIGYNVEKINELAEMLINNYKTIGEKMAEGWPNLSATMEKEWVGPDEVSYEKELAANICKLYESCTTTVVQMVQNIDILGQNWVEFQKNNILTGGSASTDASPASVQNIEPKAPSLQPYEIASHVKAGNPTFAVGTNMGLTNGTQSGANIKTVFDSYIDAVYTSVQGLYMNIDASQAFLGSELSAKVSEYLATVGEALAKLTTCHKSIYDALDQLIAAYATHETDEATNISSAAGEEINFNGQNLK